MINYYLLTKPGIILGNLITVAAGFFLAAQGSINAGLFVAVLIGLSLIMASACVFNNYIDRFIDTKMERTKNRALVTGLISCQSAITFGTLLGIAGNLVLFLYTNLLTLLVADCGFFIYVVLYSLWKCRTIYGTAIGSLAGAVPPVVGYCAVSNQLDLKALILFLIMVLWQMPHFFSIAIYRLEDYTAAKIPVLPIIKGTQKAKIHMFFYILAFLLSAAMLTFFNYTGYAYLFVTLSFGLAWLMLSLAGFKTSNEQQWGRQMFRLSLLTITALCLMISFDTVLLSPLIPLPENNIIFEFK